MCISPINKLMTIWSKPDYYCKQECSAEHASVSRHKQIIDLDLTKQLKLKAQNLMTMASDFSDLFIFIAIIQLPVGKRAARSAEITGRFKIFQFRFQFTPLSRRRMSSRQFFARTLLSLAFIAHESSLECMFAATYVCIAHRKNDTRSALAVAKAVFNAI